VPHLLTGDFPDGQLFVDLHAHTPDMKPADPGEVLAGLLACTGMAPGQIPAVFNAAPERRAKNPACSTPQPSGEPSARPRLRSPTDPATLLLAVAL
jgi:hypothetical protein